MKRDISVGKAPALPCLEERIAAAAPAVNRDKYILAVRSKREGHVIGKPALDPSPTVIVASKALGSKVLAALKAVDIELPHVSADLLEAFDQFAVGHVFTSPLVVVAVSIYLCLSVKHSQILFPQITCLLGRDILFRFGRFILLAPP